nr:InlB B-repeat-containing protein [Bifidobacterium choladohabitans]
MSSTTGTPDSADSAPAKSIEKTDDQATHVVRFDPADGSTSTPVSVKTGTLATPPQHNPQRDGFRFDGWTLDNQPFDFQTPVLQNTTLKAKWSKTTDWTLSPDHGPATGARLTINPPNKKEPRFASVHAAEDQAVGLTGDGHIYTWTQDGTTVRVPSPAQAPDGFHYLQAAAGSRRQAALGSDQHIYTWNSQQTTPTIVDTGRNAEFTSINISGDRLLAVDRQGQVNTYQASQNPNPKLIEQAATSLPGEAQAVTAIASGSRILSLDSDGQAWTWDTGKTGNIKPTRIKQDTKTRIIQAQALNQGFLLLDADGHAYHLADSMTSLTAINLPESMKASSATTNKNQAMITGKDGHIWAWKPGEAPTRADNGSKQYTQAAEADGRITAINRQGDIYRWSLDGQGQPGKPAGLDTVSEPTLDTVSMDGQPLTIIKKNDTWQADASAHKPGPAAITLAGRQDGQPFTRSLNYTVDQRLTRDDQQGTTHTVTFNAYGGSPRPADQNISDPYGRVKRPTPDPTREGYQFDGWFIGEVAYDFSKPVTKDLTLTAKWTESGNNKWSISPDKGSQLGRESTTITPPNTSRGIRFSQLSGSRKEPGVGDSFSLAVGSDGNAYAWGQNWYGQLGDGTKTNRNTPVMVKTPDRKTYPDLPADFTYVQVSAGYHHSLAVGSDGNAYAWGNSQTTTVMVSKPEGAPADFTYMQVSAGYDYSLAVGSDGNAYAWGNNEHGQLGDGTTINRYAPVKVGKPADFTYVQVSAGTYHSLALGSDGNVYTWGNSQTTPVMVEKPDRKMYPDLPRDFTYVQVSAGSSHSLALGSDGNVYAWGNNRYGQLGDGTRTTRTTPVMVEKPDRKMYPDLPRDFTYVQVSAGSSHSLALGSDGYAYAWGWNFEGELGNNSSSNSSVPVRARDSTKPNDTSKGLQAVQIGAGAYHSLAVGSDGYTYAWGWNCTGQLGNGNYDGSYHDYPVPAPVVFNLMPVITGVRFDQTAVSGLTRGDGSSVTVLTPAHQPGTVTVSVDYMMGGTGSTLTDKSLAYTYLPAGVLPKAGGEGILLALATGMTGIGGVLASRRHRKEQHRLLHASLE